MILRKIPVNRGAETRTFEREPRGFGLDPDSRDVDTVRAHLPLSNDRFGTADEREQFGNVEARRMDVVDRDGTVGIVTGMEMDGDEYYVFAHGPTAERLVRMIAPEVRGSSRPRGTYLTMRRQRLLTGSIDAPVELDRDDAARPGRASVSASDPKVTLLMAGPLRSV